MTDPQSSIKREIRARMRATLQALTEQQRHAASVRACNKLIALEAMQHANVVMLYLPLENEVDVTPTAIFCFRQAKTVCVPKVDWDHGSMHPVEIDSFDDRVLDTDRHGVRVPKGSRLVLPDIIDVVVVPGLAFDSRGNRLGRGGGYYDRFLAELRPSVTRIGLAFDQQIVEPIPAGAHDMAVDILVTDRRVTHAKSARTTAS